jgi:uncharacterized membrane protein YeaQ/YmgE (transglycosylase-associated protein family)
MKRLGWFLVILGVGSFILPLFGLQFKLMMLFGDSPIAAIVMAIVGAIILVVSGGDGSKRTDRIK